MKLFTRTLFFFISVIAFQAILTVFVITNIIENSNSTDAKRELKSDAGIMFDSYNSWKQSIWKSIIGLENDIELKAIFESTDINIRIRGDILNYLRDKLTDSGMDYITIKSTEKYSIPYVVPISSHYISISVTDFEFENKMPHPYIKLVLYNNDIYFVGTFRLESNNEDMEGSNPPVDIFIIKRIDDAFCTQLTHNKRSRVVFFLEDPENGSVLRYLIGTVDKSLFDNDLSFIDNQIAYSEYYDIEIKKYTYNLAFQKLGTLVKDEYEYDMFLATFLSNKPYSERLILVNNTVLYVSLISALFTIILSLYFSGNITKPVKNLLIAMHSIQNGEFSIRVKIKNKSEMGELLNGFNEMALNLEEDKVKMRDYIRKITMLSNYNEQVIHSIGEGVLIIRSDLKIEKVNKFFLQSFGLQTDNVLDKTIEECCIDIFDSSIIRNVKNIISMKKDFYTKSKRTENNKVFEIRLYPLIIKNEKEKEVSRCIVITNDISRKTEFEEKIFQAEKLSSISMLSAGIAHEINNPLSSIMTNVQNLMTEEQNDEKKDSLKWIEQETRRIARITQELLDFSSSRSDENNGANANEVIMEVINLINYFLEKEKNIKIIRNLYKGELLTVVSKDELKQIIINLVKNSIQAVKKQGEINIVTKLNKEKGLVCICIRDNGMGIKNEILNKIFDPFFTTKKNGVGTGLGLSVTYGIINKYNGAIRVKSKESMGTEIILEIPVFETQL